MKILLALVVQLILLTIVFTMEQISNQLPIDLDSLILKIYNFFSIYTIRTESLKEFCDFVCIEYRSLLYHSKTRWLSLYPAINRILQMFPALKSF